MQKWPCKWLEGTTPLGGVSLTWKVDLTGHTAEALLRKPDGTVITLTGVFDSIVVADPLANPPVEPESIFHFNIDGADVQAGTSIIRVIVKDGSGAAYPHIDIQAEAVEASL